MRGDEAVLVGTAIDMMIDALLVHVDFVDEEIPDCDSGIAVYDRLTACQRIGLLHDIAHHLLSETDAPMPLSAMAEATVAAVFVEVRDQLAIEIDLFGTSPETETDCTWRSLVLAAYRAAWHDPRASPGAQEALQHLPETTTIDLDRWEDLIDVLAGAILWDRDFEMADSFLDIDPGVSLKRRKMLGIHDDYFTSVAPDPRPEEAFGLVSKTRELVRGKSR